MKKVLITGGLGFIGFHLADYLSRAGSCDIHIADNLSRGKLDKDMKTLISKNRINFIKCDLTDKNIFSSFAKDYDYIYHLTALVGVKNILKSPDRVLYVNSVSILNLLEWIRKTQLNLKRLLFSSTSEVYTGTLKHFTIPIPTDEKVALCLYNINSPRTTYALSKMLGESACYNYSKVHPIPVTIVRYHNVYGPRMGYDHVIPELMIKAKNSKKHLEVFSLNHTRAFCYVSDVVEATVALAQSKDACGEIVNVGNSDEEVSMKNLSERIINLVNSSLSIKPAGIHEGSPYRRCPDIGKMKRLINFKPKVKLDEGLRLTWEWYKKRQ